MRELFNQILEEIKAMPEFQEINGDEQKYYELIDSVLEDWQDTGKIGDDFDVESLRDKLKSEWRDIEFNN